jgi:hypothetical protein
MTDLKRNESGFSATIDLVYTAVVCGDGRVMPITETIGRRTIRDIDPESREGREMLQSGEVTLWSDEGRRIGKVPLSDLLSDMEAALNVRKRRHSEIPRWRRHHADMARSISRSKKALSS